MSPVLLDGELDAVGDELSLAGVDAGEVPPLSGTDDEGLVLALE